MCNMRGKIWVIGLLFWSSAMAQISPVEQAIEYLVEFGQTENANPDLVQLAEQLTYLQNNPIPINQATADDLLEIPLLTSFQAFGILNYRKSSGKILSYYQLADIKGLSKEIIQLLKHFTTLESKREESGWPAQFNHQLALQYRRLVQRVRGNTDGQYQGDASAAYFRYRLQGDQKLFAGITAQKDAGEPWLINNQPDFLSVHLEYRPNTVLKNILVGDFSAEFGQGLVLWTSLAFNKSSEAVTIERFGRGIRHYTGADENRFLRGAGGTVQFKDWSLTTYLSGNTHDANVIVANDGKRFATALQNAGTHRTINERADKNALQIKTGGAYLQWKPSRFRIGLLTNATQFSIPIQFSDRLENAKRFSGSNLMHNSLDFKWLYGRMFVFGELGHEWTQNTTAFTGGLKVMAADELQWTVQFRHLSTAWFAPLSQPFSETGGAGERGLYVGLNWQISSRFTLAAFADHFQYLWVRTNTNKPGNGRDYMAQLNFTQNRLNMYVRSRFQERLRTLPGDEIIRDSDMQKRSTLRWHTSYTINRKWVMQSRVELAFSQLDRQTSGSLFFLGLRYNPTLKWQFRARYTLFDTQDFSSAIYAFEADLPFNFSVPGFSNKGSRWYIMATYKVLRHVELWLRVADTFYPDLSTLGSGSQQIEGGRRTTVKAMVRWAF